MIHFETHQNNVACNRNSKNPRTEKWQNVTCRSCKKTEQYQMAKQLDDKHKNLRQAIIDRVDMKLRVTPEQSEIVQKIAFECGIYWRCGIKEEIKHTDYNTIGVFKRKGDYRLWYNISLDESVFLFENDCFAGDIGQGKDPLSAYDRTLDDFMVPVKGDLKTPKKRPPLGLKPKFIHDEGRAEEILEAIERYTKAEKPIPAEWTEELKGLTDFFTPPEDITFEMETLTEIKQIIKKAIQCEIKYFDGLEKDEMQQMAIDIKHKAFFQIMELLTIKKVEN